MARTIHPLTGDGADFDNVLPYIAGSGWGYQDAEWTRQAIDVLAYLGLQAPLGAARDDVGHVTGDATWVSVDPSKTYTLDGDQLGGLTLEAVVVYRTEHADQAVQVRVRNATDGSNAALGTSSTSTSWVTETLTLTLASGSKAYRLEVTGGDEYASFAGGYIRIRKVPA